MLAERHYKKIQLVCDFCAAVYEFPEEEDPDYDPRNILLFATLPDGWKRVGTTRHLCPRCAEQAFDNSSEFAYNER